ncbi:hypothetical protein ABZ545_07140 [Streptomyces abikoensis]|uniref:hypothetical protein n=1 Tax=Streptomyces abikoensis TaxID=97398 RepID=UPI0033E68F1B
MPKRKNEKDKTKSLTTVIKGGSGPLHLGTGSQISNSVVISGDGAGQGATVVKGNKRDGISKSF